MPQPQLVASPHGSVSMPGRPLSAAVEVGTRLKPRHCGGGGARLGLGGRGTFLLPRRPTLHLRFATFLDTASRLKGAFLAYLLAIDVGEAQLRAQRFACRAVACRHAEEFLRARQSHGEWIRGRP